MGSRRMISAFSSGPFGWRVPHGPALGLSIELTCLEIGRTAGELQKLPVPAYRPRNQTCATRRKDGETHLDNKPAASDNGKQAGGGHTLARGRWNGTEITNFQPLFSAGANGNASRIIFGRY